MPEAKGITFHRFPTNPDMRKQWLQALEMSGENVGNSTQICSRHFHFKATTNVPSVCIRKKLGPADPNTDCAEPKRLREQHYSPLSPKKSSSAQTDLPQSGIPLDSDDQESQADCESSIASAFVPKPTKYGKESYIGTPLSRH